MATKVVPPMVVGEQTSLTGFSVDLWNAIATRLNEDYTWVQLELDEIFVALETEQVEVAIAAITMTHEREARVDFSHPILDSGLRIAISTDTGSTVTGAWNALREGPLVRTFFYFLGFVVLCGHILWYAEHGQSAIADPYFPGIFEAFWCVLTTMTTVGYGDIAPRRWLGRLAAALVMLTGISFFGFVLSQFTAGLVGHNHLAIEGFEDLPGRNIGTVRGTTAESELRRLGSSVTAAHDIKGMQDLLFNGTVDAIVYDSPVILHLVKQNSQRAKTIGDLFARQDYGIAFPENSPWIEPVNRELLELREDGTYEFLCAKWFSES